MLNILSRLVPVQLEAGSNSDKMVVVAGEGLRPRDSIAGDLRAPGGRGGFSENLQLWSLVFLINLWMVLNMIQIINCWLMLLRLTEY